MIKTGIYCGNKGYESEFFFVSELNNIAELKIVGYYSENRNCKLSYYKQYPTYDKLLEDIDAIIVLYNDFLTTDLTNTLKKLKHLYFINSQNICLEEIKNLYKIAEEANVIIHPAFSQIKHSAVENLRSFITKPLYIETNFHKNIPSQSFIEKNLADMLFDDLLTVLSLINSRVKKISTNFSSVSDKQHDTVCVNIEFYNGAIAKLSAGAIAAKENHEIKLYCNDKLINVDISKNKSWIITKKEEKTNKTLFSENIGNLIVREFITQNENLFSKEIKLFANLILSQSSNNDTIELLIDTQSVQREILSKLNVS